MRVALIADTHGSLDARIANAVSGCDLLVHAGDVGGTVAAELATLSQEFVIVQGNNDPPDSGWPESVSRALPGGQLVVIHGHQWPAKTRHSKLRAAFPEAVAIVCGHSHRRILEDERTPWILNPGAAGRTRAYGGPGYIQLTVREACWTVQAHDLTPAPRGS